MIKNQNPNPNQNQNPTPEITALSNSVAKLARARGLANSVERKRAIQEYYFPVPSQRYEYVLIFVNWAIVFGFGWKITHELKAAATPLWRITLCVPLAFFIADLMSAGFHKWLDSYASELNPLWGSAARAFRIHHEFPKNLNGATYWHNVSAFAPFMTFLFALVFLARAVTVFSPCVSLTIELLIVLFSQGTEIHRQSHMAKSPRLIRALQRMRILLSPKVHRHHHSRDLDSDYGIINGWSNWILTAADVWPKLDRWLWKRLKLFPRNWIQVSPSIPPNVMAELLAHPSKIPQEIAIYESVFPRLRTPFADPAVEPREAHFG